MKLLPRYPFGRWNHAARPIVDAADARISVEKPVPKILTGLGYLWDWIIEFLEQFIVLTTGQIYLVPVVIFPLAGGCLVTCKDAYRID